MQGFQRYKIIDLIESGKFNEYHNNHKEPPFQFPPRGKGKKRKEMTPSPLGEGLEGGKKIYSKFHRVRTNLPVFIMELVNIYICFTSTGSHEKKRAQFSALSFLFTGLLHATALIEHYFPNFMEACAAARRAIGTRKGEQLTYVSHALKQNSTEAGSPPCSPQIPTLRSFFVERPF